MVKIKQLNNENKTTITKPPFIIDKINNISANGVAFSIMCLGIIEVIVFLNMKFGTPFLLLLPFIPFIIFTILYWITGIVILKARHEIKESEVFKMRGTVKWFGKSYGFITDSEGNDVFVHHKQIKMDGFRLFHSGDIVSFELGKAPGNDRIQAVNVEPILTLSMVEEALNETIIDAYGNRILYKDISLEQLAARAGIKVKQEVA